MTAWFKPQGRIYRRMRGWYRAQRSLRRLSSRFVFLLGHMRSGSSVLVHILNTNPEILGFGESHIRYRVPEDLDWLVCDAHRRLGKVFLRDAWIMDKVLHAERIQGEFLAAHPRCRFIFLIREPAASVPSMIRCFPDWFTGTPLEPEALERTAIEYYCEQLAWLVSFAKTIPDPTRAVFLTHPQLLDETKAVFSSIEHLLHLSKALEEEYTVVETTGTAGVGDISPMIQRGRLDRSGAGTPKSVTLAAGDLERCQMAFETCSQFLTERFAGPTSPTRPG